MSSKNINQYLLNGQGGLHQPDAVENDHQVTWYHVKYTDKQARSWIKKQSQLSSQSLLVLLNNETRPRAHVTDEEVSMCLRGINFNEEAQPEDMISVRVWLNKTQIISSSNQGSQSIKNLQYELSNNNGPKTSAEFLLSLIDQLAKLTDEFVDKMDEKIDAIEDTIADNQLNVFNPQMNQLRRQIANIRRYLLPQKEAIDKLYRQKSALFNDTFYEQVYLHSDKFMQLIESLDLMRERALMLQEHFMANISHQQNSRLYLLAIISAVFLPLTFLSGLFGMNVAGMPGIENNQAFWYIIIFSVGLTAALLVWFKKSRWF